MKPKTGVFSAFALKLMMAAFMLLDHLYYFLPQGGFPIWFTMLGRLVAPTFCFLMTESLYHTRDRARYIRRLWTAGIAMFGGSLLLMTVVSTLTGRLSVLSNSIFLSLAVGAVLVDRLERIAQNGLNLSDGAVILLMALVGLLVEGMYLIPILSLIFYFLRDRKALMALAYLLVGSLVVRLLVGVSSADPRYAFELFGLRLHTQYLQVFALVPILLYNGTPGWRSGFSKHFFYVFYPLHVWILYLASALV